MRAECGRPARIAETASASTPIRGRACLAGLAGRTATRVDVGSDRPAGTGVFRGYVDDLVIADEGAAYAGTNLALTATASGSAPCVAAETPQKAVDGVIAGNSKWCSGAAGPSLQVDLGAAHTVRRFVVKHAATGGESLDWNTHAYTIQVSGDGGTWTTLVTVTGNTDGVTTHAVNATPATRGCPSGTRWPGSTSSRSTAPEPAAPGG